MRRRDVNRDRSARLLSLRIDGTLAPRTGEDGLGTQAPSDTSLDKYVMVEPDQLVVNPMWLTGGSIGVSKISGAVSPAYRVYDFPTEVTAAFAHHALRSHPFRSQYAMLGRGETTFDRSVSADDFENLRLAWPDTAEQRRIADFLDDRVGRIDRIIAARREQAQLVVARERSEWALADQSLVDLPHVPLRRVVRSIADGPFGSSLSSKHYSDSGVRVIRLGNVGIGQFRNHDKAYIPDAYGEQLKQFRVSAGEVIMAGLGDERWPLGRCAVVPEDIGPAINKADCYRLQLSDEVSARFIALNLSGPRSEGETALLARGSTRARLNTEIAGDRTVPLAPEPRQAEYVRTVERARAETKDATGALTRSIDLLTEYKQSLITAAVTGQFDVTTASTGIPE